MAARLAGFLATSLVLFLACVGVDRLYGSLSQAPWTRVYPPTPKAKPIPATVMPPEPHAERAGRNELFSTEDAFMEPVFKKKPAPEPAPPTALSQVQPQTPAPEPPKPAKKPAPAVKRPLTKVTLGGSSFGAAGMDMDGASPRPQAQHTQQLQPMMQAEEPQEAPPSSAPAPAKRTMTSITRPEGGTIRPVQQQPPAPEPEPAYEPPPAEEGE